MVNGIAREVLSVWDVGGRFVESWHYWLRTVCAVFAVAEFWYLYGWTPQEA